MTVEFEHHGLLPISSEVEVYQHWEDDIWDVPLAAVLVGFEEVVATFFAGEIIRFDVYDPLYVRTMRVALSDGQFQRIEHQELSFSPTSLLYVEEKGTGRGFTVRADQEVTVIFRDGTLCLRDPQGELWDFGQRVYLWPNQGGLIQINSFQRGTSSKFYPQYRGRFELVVDETAGFLAINEVGLEEYLYQVVPSEMPISWPLEALKAQAIAARTYAVAQVIYSRQGQRGFHVTDNTNSQVYNNHNEATATTQAIDATAGQILAKADNTIESTYFYSTSSGGQLLSKKDWENKSDLALQGNSPWYRWQTSFTGQELTPMLESNLGLKLGNVVRLEIEERDYLGRVACLVIHGTEGQAIIQGELNIRKAFTPTLLSRINDSLQNLALLPSAFFSLETQQDTSGLLKKASFYGGGSGHGLGMSQWGAKGLAEAGHDYLSILDKYYPEAHLITHSKQLRY